MGWVSLGLAEGGTLVNMRLTSQPHDLPVQVKSAQDEAEELRKVNSEAKAICARRGDLDIRIYLRLFAHGGGIDLRSCDGIISLEGDHLRDQDLSRDPTNKSLSISISLSLSLSPSCPLLSLFSLSLSLSLFFL